MEEWQTQIAAVYKDMIHKQGCRATKKAEKLIFKLCEAMPLAVRKGNTEPEIQIQGTKSGDEAKYSQLTIFDL